MPTAKRCLFLSEWMPWEGERGWLGSIQGKMMLFYPPLSSLVLALFALQHPSEKETRNSCWDVFCPQRENDENVGLVVRRMEALIPPCYAMHEASLHWEEDGVGRANMRSSYAYAFFLLLWSEMPLACRVLTLSLSLWQDDWSECASSFPFSCICYLPSRVFFISSYEDKTQFVLWQRMTHSWDHCSSFLLKL